MTEDQRGAGERGTKQGAGRRIWKRPVVTAYGPIGKLTQGGTGTKDDSGSGKKK